MLTFSLTIAFYISKTVSVANDLLHLSQQIIAHSDLGGQ